MWVTRKGAVRAGDGDLGIIPGSMGAKSYIVRGKGNAKASSPARTGRGGRCRAARPSGASRWPTMSRRPQPWNAARTQGVIDETPMAYKDIDAVMAAQADLVEIVHTLRQVVCVKG